MLGARGHLLSGPAAAPGPGTDSASAHGHRPGGGEPRLDREATGSHPGLGGAEVSARSDWTSWSLEGGRLRTQRASPQGPRGSTPAPQGAPPRLQVGGHWLCLGHRQRHTPGHSSSS